MAWRWLTIWFVKTLRCCLISPILELFVPQDGTDHTRRIYVSFRRMPTVESFEVFRTASKDQLLSRSGWKCLWSEQIKGIDGTSIYYTWMVGWLSEPVRRISNNRKCRDWKTAPSKIGWKSENRVGEENEYSRLRQIEQKSMELNQSTDRQILKFKECLPNYTRSNSVATRPEF